MSNVEIENLKATQAQHDERLKKLEGKKAPAAAAPAKKGKK